MAAARCGRTAAGRAALAAVLLAGCTPVTTRPDFLPYPEAPSFTIDATAQKLLPEIASRLQAESLTVERGNVRDGYIESAWFNVRTRQSHRGFGDPGDLSATVKIRCWIDPNIPGRSQVTIEAVYRPRLDPSRPERDLEALAPDSSAGQLIAQRLLEGLKQKFGT